MKIGLSFSPKVATKSWIQYQRPPPQKKKNLRSIFVATLSQVDTLQRNLASVIQFVSERSRHSSSSQDTPPLSRSGHSHMMTASLDLQPGQAAAPQTTNLPSSMTMSLPPSLLLPAPVTLSKSCDSLAQVQESCNEDSLKILGDKRWYWIHDL